MASAGKYVAARRMGAAMVAGVAVAAVATLRSGKGDVGSLKALLKSVVTGPGSTSRIVAILVVLANFKNLPLVWHYRVLGAFFRHIELSTHDFSETGNGPSALFQPTICTSRAPFTECDYNIHKSNSTYFSDMDVSRSHVVVLLLRDAFKKIYVNPSIIIGPDGQPAKGKFATVMGATHCSFKRQIAPYEAYEMWSRVLCWDRKWIYIVTHFVKKGAVRPRGYTLNPPGKLSALKEMLLGGGKSRSRKNIQKESNGTVPEVKAPNGNSAILASAISKYVFKIGRLTVHPEVVLDLAGLLPPRPGGWSTSCGSSQPASAPSPADGAAAPPNSAPSGAASKLFEVTESELLGGVEGEKEEEGPWNWKRVEKERDRGMEYAKHFAALDGLEETFTGEGREALGVY